MALNGPSRGRHVTTFQSEVTGNQRMKPGQFQCLEAHPLATCGHPLSDKVWCSYFEAQIPGVVLRSPHAIPARGTFRDARRTIIIQHHTVTRTHVS